jgi:hypothetical protein
MRSIKSRANDEDIVTPLAATAIIGPDTFFTSDQNNLCPALFFYC